MGNRRNGYAVSVVSKDKVLVTTRDLVVRRLTYGALQRFERRLMRLPPTEWHSFLFQFM